MSKIFLMSKFFEKKCKKNVELAPYTTFKIGGLADYFCVAKNADDLVEAAKFAKEKGLNYYILSGGSNVLIPDEGFRGLVIKVKSSKLKVQSDLVDVDAGVGLGQLVNACLENGLCGLEFLAGIPGTVGGSVYGNAGAYGKEIKDYLMSVRYLDLDKLEIKEVLSDDLKFRYRYSEFCNKNRFILSVKFRLDRCDNVEKSRSEIKRILMDRRERIPEEPSAGCIFKNIMDNVVGVLEKLELSEEDKKKYLDYNKVPVAILIDQAGLKGKQVGGARVSKKHANFIINKGEAKAEDVIKLINLIKDTVKNKFGVELKLEIVLLD